MPTLPEVFYLLSLPNKYPGATDVAGSQINFKNNLGKDLQLTFVRIGLELQLWASGVQYCLS